MYICIYRYRYVCVYAYLSKHIHKSCQSSCRLATRWPTFSTRTASTLPPPSVYYTLSTFRPWTAPPPVVFYLVPGPVPPPWCILSRIQRWAPSLYSNPALSPLAVLCLESCPEPPPLLYLSSDWRFSCQPPQLQRRRRGGLRHAAHLLLGEFGRLAARAAGAFLYICIYICIYTYTC